MRKKERNKKKATMWNGIFACWKSHVEEAQFYKLTQRPAVWVAWCEDSTTTCALSMFRRAPFHNFWWKRFCDAERCSHTVYSRDDLMVLLLFLRFFPECALCAQSRRHFEVLSSLQMKFFEKNCCQVCCLLLFLSFFFYLVASVYIPNTILNPQWKHLWEGRLFVVGIVNTK